MRSALYITVITALCSGLLFAQGEKKKSTEEIITQLTKETDVAKDALNAQREELAAEQVQFSKDITEKQQELITKRRQADIARRSVSDHRELLKSKESREYASRVEVSTYADALKVFGQKLDIQFFPGEPKDSRLDAAYAQQEDINATLDERLQILEVGIERLEAALGGHTYITEVTDENDRFITGTVLTFGPSRWFLSDDGSVAGSYHLSRSRTVATIDSKETAVAKALHAGEQVSVNIDITGGKAKALAQLNTNPLDLIKKGGAWVYPILLLALIAFGCAVKKFFSIIGLKEVKDEVVISTAADYLQGDSIVDNLSPLKHPVAGVLTSVSDVLGKGSVDLAEEVLYERMIPVKEKLRSWLPFIAVTAAIAPLLGLLGTVSGLIKTFSVIAIEGTGEAQSISGGISEALITTLFGLAVAIPAFILHALLSRKAKGIEQNTERLSLVFLNEIRKSRVS